MEPGRFTVIARTLDALSMLRAAGRELGRIAVSRGGGLRDDPLSASAITPELMDEALSAACPGVHVGQLRTLDGHSGTTDRARIAIRCEQPGDGETPIDDGALRGAIREVGDRYGMNWDLRLDRDVQRVAIFVSKYDHCLWDLLLRHRAGEFACEVPLIVSNHEDLRPIAEQFGVTVEALAAANGIDNPDLIQPGDTLTIPAQ